MADLPYDLQNRDIAIRTIIGEDPSMEGSAGVAAVLLNRLASGKYGASIDDVVTASNQFEAWARQRDDLLNISTDDPRYIRIGQTLDAIATGAMPDPTNGATHFFGRGSQAALGRAPPAWGMQPGQMLGGSEFYAPEGRVSYQAKSGVARQPYHPREAGLSDADLPSWMKGGKFARQLPDAATAPKPTVAATAPDQSQLPDWMKGGKFAKELPPEHVGPPSVGEQIALHDRAAVTKPAQATKAEETPVDPMMTSMAPETPYKPGATPYLEMSKLQLARGMREAPGVIAGAIGEPIAATSQQGRENVAKGIEEMKSGTLSGMALGAGRDVLGTAQELFAPVLGAGEGVLSLAGMGDPMMTGVEGAGAVGRLAEETPKEVPKDTGELPALPPGVPSGKIPVAALSSSERFPTPPKPAELPMHLEGYKPSLREAREPEGSESATEPKRYGDLRVAVRMPDGNVRIGKPGQLHSDLLSDEEMDHIKMDDQGFVDTNGNFLTRKQGLAIAEKENTRSVIDDRKAARAVIPAHLDEFKPSKRAAKEAEAEPQAVGAAVSPKGPPLPPEPPKEWIRELEGDLNRYRGRRSADRPDLVQTYVDPMPERYKDPKVQAKWDAYGQGDPKAILTDDELEGFQKYYAQEKGPKEEQENNYIEAMDLKKKYGAGVEEADINPHYMRRNVKGKTPQFDPKDEGQINPIGGRRSLPQSTSSMKERKFFALQDDFGNRKVVVHMSDGDWMVVEPGHSYPIDVPKDTKFNQVFVDGGGTKWRLTNAFTREITEVGGPEYYENAMANAVDNLLRQEAVLDGLYLYRDLTQSSEWKAWARSRFDASGRIPEGYRIPRMPLFHNWYVDPRIADALDNYHGYAPVGGQFFAGANRLAMATMFWQPTAHWLNVLDHWAEGRSFDWARPKGWYSLVADGGKAFKSVLSMDKTYQDVLKEGGALLYSGVVNADFYQRLMRSLGDDIVRNPAKWQKVADTLGLGLPQLAQAWYRGVQKALWAGSDMMLMQRVLELKRKGMDTREAVQEAQRHIPAYQVPSRIAENFVGADLSAKLSRAMQDPSIMAFGRYHYDVLKSYSNLIKDLVGPPAKNALGESRRVEAIGSLLVLAGSMAFVNPMLQWGWREISGAKDDQFKPRGPQALLYPLIDMPMQTKAAKEHLPSWLTDYYDGNSDVMNTLGNLMIIPPETKAVVESLPGINTDLFTGKKVAQPEDINKGRIPRVIGDELEHFAESSFQPYQFEERARKMAKSKDALGEVEEVLKQAGKSALNITTPNKEGIKAVKYFQSKDAAKNAAKDQGVLHNAGDWLQQWINHNVLGQ